MPEDMIVGPPSALYNFDLVYQYRVSPTFLSQSLRRQWDTLGLAGESAYLKKTGGTRRQARELKRLTARMQTIEQDEAKLESEIVKAVKAKDNATVEAKKKDRTNLVEERKGIMDRLTTLRNEIKHSGPVTKVREHIDALNTANHVTEASLKGPDYARASMLANISAQGDKTSADYDESASTYAASGGGLVPGLGGSFFNFGASRN